MRVGRTIALALALLVAAAAVAPAATKNAGWKSGNYSGTTEGQYKPTGNKPLRKARITFYVGKHQIAKIRVEIRVKCADGSHTSFQTAHSGALSLDKKGRFSGGADTQTGRDNISGKVSGTQASGRVRSYDKEDQNGNEDPNGQKCDSGRIAWTAHRAK
jgi:hypothetical protein